MHEPLTVLLVMLTVWRVTRVVVLDAFPPVAAVRDAVADRFGPDSSWAYLVECPWCVSMYVAPLVIVPTILLGVSVPVPVLVGLAASGVTGLIDRNLDN